MKNPFKNITPELHLLHLNTFNTFVRPPEKAALLGTRFCVDLVFENGVSIETQVVVPVNFKELTDEVIAQVNEQLLEHAVKTAVNRPECYDDYQNPSAVIYGNAVHTRVDSLPF